ncbi:MAG: DHH family phosphoesterase [Christensenellales bacterium]|jgi:phosphoesterase RecJ-like protein
MNNIIDLIHRYNNIAIISHVAPDGDTVGASVALKIALDSLGKNADLFCDDPIPATYGFMTKHGSHSASLPDMPYHLAIAVDCADRKRMGRCSEILDRAADNANIDHHYSNIGYADYNYIDPNASSASEIMVDFIQKLGVEISQEIATCLYAGIAYDTGNFAYSNTGFGALSKAAFLLKRGVNVVEVVNQLFKSRTIANMRMLKICIDNARFYPSMVVTSLSLEEMGRYGAQPSDCDSIVDFMRDLEGVEIAAFVREMQAGRYKISLRSKYYADVAAVAGTFGGGGHIMASGCVAFGSLEQVLEELLPRLEAAL